MDVAFTPIYNASALVASRHDFPLVQKVGPPVRPSWKAMVAGSFSIESLDQWLQSGDSHLIQGDVFTQLS